MAEHHPGRQTPHPPETPSITPILCEQWRGWAIWLAFAIVVTAIGWKTPILGYDHYRVASLAWWSGEDLYGDKGCGFLYLPHAAVLYSPFALLPEQPAAVLWRIVNIAFFAVGTQRLAALAPWRSVHAFSFTTLVALMTAASAARLGQMTLVMGAAMMLAAAALAEQRWSRGTFWLCLGIAIKPLAIVLLLLAFALIPQVRRPLLLMALGVAAFPFLFQHPAYVLHQHASYVDVMRAATNLGLQTTWPQLFTLLHLAHVDVPAAGQTMVRLLAACLTLGLCVLVVRWCDRRQAALFLVAFSVCYLLLFNPRTENNTYALLGPVLGVFAMQALFVERRPVFGLSYLAIAGCFFLNRPLHARLLPPEWLHGVKPMLCMAAWGLLLCHLWKIRRLQPFSWRLKVTLPHFSSYSPIHSRLGE